MTKSVHFGPKYRILIRYFLLQSVVLDEILIFLMMRAVLTV